MKALAVSAAVAALLSWSSRAGAAGMRLPTAPSSGCFCIYPDSAGLVPAWFKGPPAQQRCGFGDGRWFCCSNVAGYEPGVNAVSCSCCDGKNPVPGSLWGHGPALKMRSAKTCTIWTSCDNLKPPEVAKLKQEEAAGAQQAQDSSGLPPAGGASGSSSSGASGASGSGVQGQGSAADKAQAAATAPIAIDFSDTYFVGRLSGEDVAQARSAPLRPPEAAKDSATKSAAKAKDSGAGDSSETEGEAPRLDLSTQDPKAALKRAKENIAGVVEAYVAEHSDEGSWPVKDKKGRTRRVVLEGVDEDTTAAVDASKALYSVSGRVKDVAGGATLPARFVVDMSGAHWFVGEASVDGRPVPR